MRIMLNNHGKYCTKRVNKEIERIHSEMHTVLIIHILGVSVVTSRQAVVCLRLVRNGVSLV